MITATLKENIDGSQVNCMVNYLLPVIRKEFITFAASSVAIFSASEFLDLDTLNKDKYNTFTINKDGYVCFDYDFDFKIKMQLKSVCPAGHYTYSSRNIIVSHKSPDITKGYPIINETLSCENYKVNVNLAEKTTSIYNYESSKKPVIIPFMEISSFPCDDPQKFIKKIQNILLLA